MNNLTNPNLSDILTDVIAATYTSPHCALLVVYTCLRLVTSVLQLIIGAYSFDSSAIVSASHTTFMTSVIIAVLVAMFILLRHFPAQIETPYSSSAYVTSRLPILLIFVASSSLLFVAFFNVMEGMHVLTSHIDAHDEHSAGLQSLIAAFLLLTDLFLIFKLHHTRTHAPCLAPPSPSTSTSPAASTADILAALYSPRPLPSPTAAGASTPLLHAALVTARGFALSSLLPAAGALATPLRAVLPPGAAVYAVLCVVAWLILSSLGAVTVYAARILLQGAPDSADAVLSQLPAYDAVSVWSVDGVTPCVEAKLTMPQKDVTKETLETRMRINCTFT